MNRGWLSIGVFVALAYALAWLICLPLWLDPRQLGAPYALVCVVAMMFTPAIAAVLTLKLVERRGWRELVDVLRLRLVQPPTRFLTWLGLAAAVIYLFVFASLATSTLLGRFPFDPSMGGIAGLPGLPPGLPAYLLGVIMLLSALLNGAINTIPAAGEEIGWRGFLFPRLQERVGATGAVLIGGVIWGLWHAPIVLLGYNYPLHPVLGLIAMCGMCVLVNGALAWVCQRSGSVWPAAYGHGVLNALLGSAIIVFARPGASVDTLAGTLLGWSGWFVPALVVVVLLARRAYAPRGAPGPGVPHRSGIA